LGKWEEGEMNPIPPAEKKLKGSKEVVVPEGKMQSTHDQQSHIERVERKREGAQSGRGDCLMRGRCKDVERKERTASCATCPPV